MTLTAPLVIERVWLDKPKYDAAERRYYERLTKSLVSSKTEVGPRPTNSNVCPKPELTDDNVITETNVVENELSSSLSSVASTNDSKLSENLKDVCTRPTEGNVSSKSNSTSAKKKSEPSTPEIKDNKQEIQTPLIKKEDPNVCSLPAKAEKQKKSVSPPQKGPKMESLPKKNDAEDVCSKAKSNTKEHKQLPLQSNPKIEANITEQISEVAKLKGYFLQSKPRIPFPQSDRSLTKGTNVNTIPEISKLNQCPEKIKTNNNVKKVNQINQQMPITDKLETTQLIIPKDNISEHAVEEQVKNDAKKKKRNKKVRGFKRDVTQNPNSWNSLAGEVAKARQHIKNSLQCIDDIAVTSNTVSVEVTNRIVLLEKENQELTSRMEKMEERIVALEKALQAAATAAAATASRPVEKAAPAPKQPAPQQNNDDDDDGVDLFGSDSEEEDTEAAKIKEQRLAEYAARKAKKPVLIAKSNIILDVKPWDDETDMKLMEAEVRKIQTDGLVWGASKLVPLAYGICKLQISCVVEDDKVSVDWLQETIQEIEDYVQSVDIAAFNKV